MPLIKKKAPLWEENLSHRLKGHSPTRATLRKPTFHTFHLENCLHKKKK